METAEEKLAFVSDAKISSLEFEEIGADKKGNWINQSNNNFDSLMPVASKETKAARKLSQEKAIFKTFSLGVVTNRDDWVYDHNDAFLDAKVTSLLEKYGIAIKQQAARAKSGQPPFLDDELTKEIKWTRLLKSLLRKGHKISYEREAFRESLYRPFFKQRLYFSQELNEFRYQIPSLFPDSEAENSLICFTTGGRLEFSTFATNCIPSLTVLSLDANQCLPLFVFEEGGFVSNITDWAADKFKKHYQPGRAKPKQAITKEAIFHYVYAVLHDPIYREKYAQNLKREFPRIPLYGESDATFWQWAAWGEALMKLHIGFETVAPAKLKRVDIPDAKARKNAGAGYVPKAILKADKDAGRIMLDSETSLEGIPAEAWEYKLGNRCALEWILDQYKEKKPKDPTIREKFDTYRFADYKDKVIDLIARVTRVSVETVGITEAMKKAAR
jgi:predicted helicase